MMKIQWISGPREVPPYGLMQEGDARTLPKLTAESLIKQGLARAYTPKKEKEK